MDFLIRDVFIALLVDLRPRLRSRVPLSGQLFEVLVLGVLGGLSFPVSKKELTLGVVASASALQR